METPLPASSQSLRRRSLFDGHQIGPYQGKSATKVFGKLRADQDVVGTGDIINPERRAAAIDRRQIGERIVSASRLGVLVNITGHENPKSVAAFDVDIPEFILTTIPHEHPQIIGHEIRVADGVIIKLEVEGNAGARVIVQI